jgi:hypothetical protein
MPTDLAFEERLLAEVPSDVSLLEDGIAFSPWGNAVALCVKKGQEEFVMVGQQRGPSFCSVGHVKFSNDGSKIAYWAADLEGQLVVKGDKPDPRYEVTLVKGRAN